MADETVRLDDGASYELMMARWSVLVGERFRRLQASDGPLTVSARANAVSGMKP